MIDVNMKGPWLCVREALPLLRKDSSVADPARVVVVGSIGGIRPKVGTGFYGATKAAVHVLTGVFAAELAPTGVLVNAVAPGTVATPMIESVQNQREGSGYRLSGDSPLGRIAQPDDVVDVIMFFLSDAAKFVTGTVLPVDGGTRAAFIKK
jgi:NAD(P)-dependent dehydrogenase (short-subunit alcohol dehydrogenase family)